MVVRLAANSTNSRNSSGVRWRPTSSTINLGIGSVSEMLRKSHQEGLRRKGYWRPRRACPTNPLFVILNPSPVILSRRRRISISEAQGKLREAE
jgi:hypothetical protein